MARRVARNSPGDRLRQVSRKCETPLEDLVDKSGRDLSVEQVAHAVHEDNPRLLPPKRHAERFGMDLDAEARAAGTRVAVGLVLRVPHRLEALRTREETSQAT